MFTEEIHSSRAKFNIVVVLYLQVRVILASKVTVGSVMVAMSIGLVLLLRMLMYSKVLYNCSDVCA